MLKYQIIIIIIIIIAFFTNVLTAQSTWQVEASDYKNETLYFYTYSDYISHKLDTILEVKTNEIGGFSAEVNIESTQQVLVDLSVYKVSFYADPNTKSYLFELPKKRLKTPEEELNLYFKPIELRIGIVNNLKKDINPLIASFDEIYNSFLALNFDSIYYAPSTAIIDDFKEKTDSYYSQIENTFFETYRAFKINEIYYLGPHRNYKTICKKFYNMQPIALNNEAYMNLFNMMFKDFFTNFSITDEGARLENEIQYSRSVNKIRNTILKIDEFSDTSLATLILLKGIRDELFNPRMPGQKTFPKPQLMIVLDSIAKFDNSAKYQLIAKNIREQASTELKISDINIDDIAFEDRNGQKVMLTDFSGKYIYLNFMRTDVIASMESMERLINFNKKHNNDIEVVSVFTDKDKNAYLNIDFDKYDWNVLYLDNNQDVLDLFNLVTWPQFHLINPYGKVIMSPAPSLEENFEIKFFEVLNSRS